MAKRKSVRIKKVDPKAAATALDPIAAIVEQINAKDDGPVYPEGDDEQARVELERAGLTPIECELGTPGPPTDNPFPNGIPPAILMRPGGNRAGFHDPRPTLGEGLPTVPELIAAATAKAKPRNADNDVGSAVMDAPVDLDGDNPPADPEAPKCGDCILTEDDLPFVEEAKRQTSLELLYGRPEAGKHRVTLLRDTELEYPELWLSIFVAGNRYEQAQFAEMFSRARCRKANTPQEADIVVFTGGPDVNPALYGEKPHRDTSFYDDRDTADINLYLVCLENGIPMFGVCRGAQFLNVMNGGKLYQDIDGHNGNHSMWDVNRKKMIERVSSVHHQAVIANPKGGMEIIATANKARERWLNPKDCVRGTVADIEAFFYRDTCCIGVQGHPEYRNYDHFTQWTLELLNELVVLNPDIEWVGEGKIKHRRMKPDLLALRNGPAISITKKEK